MSNKPPIYIASPFMARNTDAWAERYTVHTVLDADEAFFAGPAKDIEVIVTGGDNLKAEVMERFPKLGLVACFSTGYAGIDYPWLKARNIPLATASGINAHDVASHATALVLAAWHQIPRADAALRSGVWRDAVPQRPSLKGKRVGVVGLGRIGGAIADCLAPHQVELSWWGPRAKDGVSYPRAETLLALAEQSDILVVASRAVEENRKHISRQIIEAVGPKGLIVNISRGMLIDEDALIDCLTSGKLGMAALDVFEDEPTPAERWKDVPNTVLTPHIAGATQDAGPAMFGRLHENVRRYFAGEELASRVDDPV